MPGERLEFSCLRTAISQGHANAVRDAAQDGAKLNGLIPSAAYPVGSQLQAAHFMVSQVL